MFLGWVINSAIIIIAAALFFPRIVTEISQAQEMLVPLLGPVAAILFAIAFLFLQELLRQSRPEWQAGQFCRNLCRTL